MHQKLMTSSAFMVQMYVPHLVEFIFHLQGVQAKVQEECVVCTSILPLFLEMTVNKIIASNVQG